MIEAHGDPMIHLTFRTKLLAGHVALVAAVVLIALFDLHRSLSADLAADLDRRLELQAASAASLSGAITVTSTPGAGSRFTIELPAAPVG